MAVGTAMLIAAGVSAAVNAYSSHKQATTAKQAAQTQVDASNVAATDVRDQTARALDYINSARNAPAPGTSGAQSYLTRLMGVPQAPQQPQGGFQTSQRTISQPGLPSGYQTLFGAVPGAPPNGMVMLEAPVTGERRSVPAAEAQAYIAKGAKRIG